MRKRILAEQKDFKVLYENISNEILAKRIQIVGDWYIEKSICFKTYFIVLSIIGMAVPLVVSGVNALGGESQSGIIKIVTIIGSLIASFGSSLLSFTRCREKWTLYRNTVEIIKSELTLYWANQEQNDKRLSELIVKLEEAMAEERKKWNDIYEDKDQQKDRGINNETGNKTK